MIKILILFSILKGWEKSLEMGLNLSHDKIDDEITLTYSPGWIISPYISNRFLSQFYDNSYPEVPRYIHPIDLTQSRGVQIKENLIVGIVYKVF